MCIFTTAITPTVAPVPATNAPTLLVAPSLRVLASLALASAFNYPDLSMRVVPNSTPPLPHIINPEDDGPVLLCRFPLRSRPWIALSERSPHLISATANFSAAAKFPPTVQTCPLFVYATCFLLAAEKYHHIEINAFINKITGRDSLIIAISSADPTKTCRSAPLPTISANSHRALERACLTERIHYSLCPTT